jgi:hypothetical protein
VHDYNLFHNQHTGFAADCFKDSGQTRRTSWEIRQDRVQDATCTPDDEKTERDELRGRALPCFAANACSGAANTGAATSGGNRRSPQASNCAWDRKTCATGQQLRRKRFFDKASAIFNCGAGECDNSVQTATGRHETGGAKIPGSKTRGSQSGESETAGIDIRDGPPGFNSLQTACFSLYIWRRHAQRELKCQGDNVYGKADEFTCETS